LCAENIEGLHTRGDQLIYKTLQAVQAHPRVSPSTPVIIIIEGVGGDTMWLGPKFHDTAQDLAMYSHVMREMKLGPEGPGFGVPKNAIITGAMIASLNGAFTRKIVAVPADCVSVGSDFALPTKTLQDQCTKLREQLTAFKINSDGSVNGKRGGENDDLVIAFMMTIYWSQRFCRSENVDYQSFKNLFPHLNEAWMLGAMYAFTSN
jgi:hypothetical protein